MKKRYLDLCLIEYKRVFIECCLDINFVIAVNKNGNVLALNPRRYTMKELLLLDKNCEVYLVVESGVAEAFDDIEVYGKFQLYEESYKELDANIKFLNIPVSEKFISYYESLLYPVQVILRNRQIDEEEDEFITYLKDNTPWL